jgi:membrane-bound lytic murein transglycosylase F
LAGLLDDVFRSEVTSPPPPPPRPIFVDKGDLDAIKARGRLRILVYGHGEDVLPRAGASMDSGERRAVRIAEQLGLEPELIAVERFSDLLPMLLDGKGDLVAARMSVTKVRREKVAFTRAVNAVDEVLVTRKGDAAAPTSLEALQGKTIVVRASSAYRETLDELIASKKLKDVIIADADESRDTIQLLGDVGSGAIAATVADSDIIKHVEAFEPNIQQAFILRKDREIAFAIRPENPALKAAIDSSLFERTLTRSRNKVRKDSFEEIRARGSIRVLTRNNSVSYFLHKGHQQGFDYEFMSLFAKEHGLRLEMIVPPTSGDLIHWLLEGRGDVIVASMTVTPERQQKVWFSPPYNVVSEVLVQKAGTPPVTTIEGLKGLSIHVRPSSSYRRTLDGLLQTAGPFTIVNVDEGVETETLLGHVADGNIEATIADSTIFAVERAWRDDLTRGVAISEGADIAIAARPDDPKLQGAIEAFVLKHVKRADDGKLRGSTDYNILKKQYFESTRNALNASGGFKATGVLSPYDDIMRTFSSQYGLDWRLMAAQAYQESRFDPNARSWVGAQGLFQVMPRTGHEMGFDKLTDPTEGTHAGIRYMASMIDSFDKQIRFKERVRFALASYNAGRGHVEDARRLAKEMGLDPNVWFRNVETAMLRLSDPSVHRRMRHGYCRGTEPVRYVSEISLRYTNYVSVIPNPGVVTADARKP